MHVRYDDHRLVGLSLVLRVPDERRADELPLDEPEIVAALRGGWQAVFQTAVAELIGEGAIRVSVKSGTFTRKYSFHAERDVCASDSGLKQRLLTLARKAGDSGATFQRLASSAKGASEKPLDRLERFGLLETSDSFRSVRNRGY